jgi:hypothetical protein
MAQFDLSIVTAGGALLDHMGEFESVQELIKWLHENSDVLEQYKDE